MLRIFNSVLSNYIDFISIVFETDYEYQNRKQLLVPIFLNKAILN